MAGSPHHYHRQETPDALHAERVTVYKPISVREKIYLVFKVLMYHLGSIMFIIGSVFFYPKYNDMWDGKADYLASWLFVSGCVCFLIGANMDFIDYIRFNRRSIIRQIANAYNGLNYVTASVVFMVGSVYFLPSYYEKSPATGAWLFFIGSIQFSIAGLVDLYFLTISHEHPGLSHFEPRHLLSWRTFVCLGTFVGSLLFIIGSYYYLPKYVKQEDEDEVEYYENLAVTLFVIGSVFFWMNGIFQVPDIHKQLTKGRRAKVVPNRRQHFA